MFTAGFNYEITAKEQQAINEFIGLYKDKWFDGLNDYLDYGSDEDLDTDIEREAFNLLLPLYKETQDVCSVESWTFFIEKLLEIDREKLKEIKRFKHTKVA